MTAEESIPRPRSVRELESVVSHYANTNGLAPARVRRSISFTIIAAVLERVQAYDGSPAFVIKGGVALERRFTGRPRTTKDFDTTFRSPGSDVTDALDDAFRTPYDGWTLRRAGVPEDIGKATRVEVRLEYEGRPWGTVPVEVSAPEGTAIPPEHVPAFNLAVFGLRGPKTVTVLPLRRQIAQKLHAMTEPPAEARENPRFRDLLDLWQLRTTAVVDGELRSQCIQIFRLRRKHAWPPQVVVYGSWPEGLARMAAEEGVEFPGVETITDEVQQFIADIDAVAVRVFAREFAEIPAVLRQNTDLCDSVYALVGSEPIAGKITEGGSRLTRFREIMERLVSGEIGLEEAIERVRVYLGPDDSPHRWNRRVFPAGGVWAERLVRTQYSRFYNQAVLEALRADGEEKCFVPHSSAENATSPCTMHMTGSRHEVASLHHALVAAYRDGQWDQSPRIPDHPHCSHCVVPVALADTL